LGEQILELYSKASREHQKWIVELNERLKPELAWMLG
jgi:hypothetical protein